MKDFITFLPPTILILLLTGSSTGQEPTGQEPTGQEPTGQEATVESETVFSDQERVTAVDVVVAFDRGQLKKWSTGRRTPKKLPLEDFEVLHGGKPRRVIAVENDGEPWTLMIYFDAATTDIFGLAWAADLLSGHAVELTGLARVEIMVADPLPRVILAATQDPDQVLATLSQIALPLARLSSSPSSTPERRPASPPVQTLAMRAEFLTEALHATPAVDPQEFARWVVREEVRIARQGQDAFLSTLVDHPATAPRRAVLVVSSGYDLRPGDFYLPVVDLHGEASGAAHLAAATEGLGQTLAAYGWVVVPLVPPPPEPEIRRGPRVGKWRLHPLGAAREAERDVGKAEAHIELAQAHLGQGHLEEAADNFKQALHHFHGDPRTAERQAFVLLELGAVQARLGQDELSRRSHAEARVLDPGQATGRLGPVVEWLDPIAPLRILAQITAGAVVTREKELTRTLENLSERIRLTYQVPGVATGELYPVSVRHQSAEEPLHGPGWARSATPTTVAAARVRARMSGAPPEGELQIRLRLDPALARSRVDGSRRGQVTVVLAEGSASDASEMLLRVTLGTGAPDALAEVLHNRPELLDGDGPRSWFHRQELTLSPDDSLIAVLVEDLYTGRWGSTIESVKDPDESENEFP